MTIETGKTRRRICFGTKAETLFGLLPLVKTARILPMYFFTVSNWRLDKNHVLLELRKTDWFYNFLVVRSSALDEDRKQCSLAGKYVSVVKVKGESDFISAVEKVIFSFETDHLNHQVLVQPYLSNVITSGVAFSRDPNTGAPYTVINYAHNSEDTSSITSGSSNHKCLIQHNKFTLSSYTNGHKINAHIFKLISELKNILNTEYLDIEYAINDLEEIYLFQARPLFNKINNAISDISHQSSIERIVYHMSLSMKPHPYLYGNKTVYGIMPDWNPAEIIGVRPKPLALSLYRELVTDSVWAYQRDNYGYKNLRSFPLLVDFEGLPYIDVRVSFNSFLPKELPSNLAERLVNYYLDRLISNPVLHDKVEFEVVFSCYSLDLQRRLAILDAYGFNEDDRRIIYQSLIKLTNNIISPQHGLWRKDLEKIQELSQRQQQLFQSDLDPISKMYWILEDCKRYGTLPFAGLARAGFIAIQILKSFISENIISKEEYDQFLSSINSITSMMKNDFQQMSKNNFLKKYGHLRPGTYDILSKRYDEEPDLYFDWEKKSNLENEKNVSFSLTIKQLRKIQEYTDTDGIQINVLNLLEFIKFSIEAREYSKFVFSKSISEFLKICGEFSSQYQISRDECAYLDLKTLMSLYSSSLDSEKMLRISINHGKQQYALTSSITLPPLITHPLQAWSFELPEIHPNFITQKNTIGKILFPDTTKESLAGAILMIPSADPGYDWIFSHKIAAFITKHGGVNSHMAIRAGELEIPAIIGAGEVKFNLWSQARKLHIDCLNQQVHML